MRDALDLLADQPVLLLTALLAVGAALGRIRVLGVPIGPAAVLFGAIAVSAFATSRDEPLQLPEVVGTLGLVMFAYTVGVISGPTFFGSLRTGWRLMAAVAVVMAVAAAVAVTLGRLLGLHAPVIAGSFAGALTNTPALAAASERAGDPAGPTIGYSITYVWGVLGMMLATAWVLRRHPDEPLAEPLVRQTVRVDRQAPVSVKELSEQYGGDIAFTRLKHQHAASRTQLAGEDEVLGPRDLVTVVGPRDLVERVVQQLGHVSSHNIVEDRHDLDHRRITLSNPALAGHTVHELGLERYGATASRVRRGDVDMIAHPAFVVQMGDRLRVITSQARLSEVSSYLGDSERGMSDINPTGLALGMTLGVLIGLVPVPVPGGGFTIGAAAGTLLTGLVFGRLGRIGPVVTSMSHGAASSLSTFGMITFLAYAGSIAGNRFAGAVTSQLGWKVALLGLVVTTLSAVSLLVAARLAGSPPRQTAGVLGGAQTQPAVLAYANEQTGSDMRVGIGYALVYPAAMIAKILLAQILAGLS
ncbi:MAG TPA: TrkA C-terminal domain-containing protein [Marmoricola sp.]|nr:TrkA C-terminal domain-containing protein [Marmoricola sp.]